MLHQYTWPARHPNGRVSMRNMLDMQAWYIRNKYVSSSSPPERLLDLRYVGAAAGRLGAFKLENTESKLTGCR